MAVKRFKVFFALLVAQA